MTASDVRIDISTRLAVVGDAAALAELAARTFHDTYASSNSPQDMATHSARSYGEAIQCAEIENASMRTLLAVHAGGIIGYSQLRLRDDRHAEPACVAKSASAGPFMEIWRFYVDRGWHGRGVAHRLMLETVGLARSLGARSIWLGVWERNPRAITFYRKCGFEVIGDHQFLFAEEPQTDLVMARSA